MIIEGLSFREKADTSFNLAFLLPTLNVYLLRGLPHISLIILSELMDF